MIRKLQRKFIGIVMLSLGIVIVILLGSINLFKYYNTANHADDMLRYLSENNGRFPDEKKLPSEKWDKPKPDGINEETGFKTRYFVIWLDIKGMCSGSIPAILLLFLLRKPLPMDSALLPKENPMGMMGTIVMA